MPTTTAKGIPKPVGADNNDVVVHLGALADWLNDMFGPFTTTQINALPTAAKWTGRRVFNTTTKEFWWYDGAAWQIDGFVRGEFRMFGGDTAPAGWDWGRGAAISRTTFAELFAILGTKYGAGNGTTTFNLPDFRKRSAVGASQDGDAAYNDRGKTGGSVNFMMALNHMPNHVHNITHGHTFTGTGVGDHAHPGPAGGWQFTQQAPGGGAALSFIAGPNQIANNSHTGNAGAHTPAGTISAFTGNSQAVDGHTGQVAVDKVDPYLTVNFIVKL